MTFEKKFYEPLRECLVKNKDMEVDDLWGTIPVPDYADGNWWYSEDAVKIAVKKCEQHIREAIDYQEVDENDNLLKGLPKHYASDLKERLGL